VTVDPAPRPVEGPLLFARFAYPPNALGYCGPDASGELLEYADALTVGGRLRDLARRFEGAWPYLELIAGANGMSDPLDRRVVQAYWIGNPLLDTVPTAAVGASLETRFRPVVARGWSRLSAVVQQAPRPHHNFHVFCVYPWVGLLRTGATDDALHVLDQCRVRWGRIEAVDGRTAVVRSRPLTWNGRALALGEHRVETVVVATDGHSLARDLTPGDLVACHWDWACHRLTRAQAVALRAETARQLDLVNRLAIPPPAAVLS
jgi:hypothetical protein